MCQKTGQIFTCGCKRDAFKRCPSHRQNVPGECHMLSPEKDEVLSVQCMDCLMEENKLAMQSMQSHLAAERARTQPRSSGTRVLRNEDRKGKGIDRTEHPNYPITRKEEEQEEEYDETSWPSQPQPLIQEDGKANWLTQPPSSIDEDDEAPWPSRPSSSINEDDDGPADTPARQRILENPSPTTSSSRAPSSQKLGGTSSDKVKGVDEEVLERWLKGEF
ncbi:hypothetical protein DSL72_001736 [Monilinia vaccinii-corymbosi]|uniref:Uncharacterized protein n=1 Tax=Monilinia vaccinii-corymbosi TaxID=61207 RepID=A0A8A3P2R3_9HELO|nr:hypothetical protein DSL72_001736 [Monilinia vaccinii-corymbosi]